MTAELIIVLALVAIAGGFIAYRTLRKPSAECCGKGCGCVGVGKRKVATEARSRSR